MSVEHEGWNKLVRFVCDEPKCRANYESGEGFRSAWAEARAHGWVNAESRGAWTHYCPEHAREYGDD
jgi:hypothetical protein